MKTVLGVEGGGSHSHAVVAAPSGEVLGFGMNDDSANWEDVGLPAASAAIRSCVMEALGAAALEASAVAASAFGLAGIDFAIDEQRLSGIPMALGLTGPCSLVNDAFVALRAGTDQSYGVVVVAGTGSVVAGRNPAGKVFRTLGLGPTFGDAGSGTEISQAGVSAAAAEFIGKGPATMLTQMLCERTKSRSVADLLEGAARGRIDDSLFAPFVIEAAKQGDQASCRILDDAGERIGVNAVHVIRTLGMEDLAFDLVLAGGMFRGGNHLFVEAVDHVVRPAAPNATFVALDAPPVVGAVLLAMDGIGEEPGPEVRGELTRATGAAVGVPVG